MKIVSRVLLVSTALVMAAGCGKTGSAGSSVTGSVSYKGSAVTGGNMLFHGKEKTYGGNLGPDGKYGCTGLPPGEYIVTIDTKSLEKTAADDPISAAKKFGKEVPPEMLKALENMKAEKAKANVGEVAGSAAKYVPIPGKYANPKTSGLTVTVGPGSNSKDLQLTD